MHLQRGCGAGDCQMCTDMGRSRLARPKRGAKRRRGLSSLDYVLILGVVLPLVVLIMRIGPRIMRLVYDMVCLLVSWPFM